MKEKDLKSLLIMAASEKVNEVTNNQTHYNSVEEFEQELIDCMVEAICDSGSDKREYFLSDALLSFAPEKIVITIDGNLYSIDASNASIMQAVWNNNLYQIADSLSEQLDYEVTVFPDTTEDVWEYKEILEGLSSESDVLSNISFLFSRFTEIEKRDKHTYFVNCNNYFDCIKIALNYLKVNNKQFEGEQYIDVIATTDNDNVFVVLTK